ncbi:hypothetical protein H5410_051190, partial [Solanum commersonii]
SKLTNLILTLGNQITISCVKLTGPGGNVGASTPAKFVESVELEEAWEEERQEAQWLLKVPKLELILLQEEKSKAARLQAQTNQPGCQDRLSKMCASFYCLCLLVGDLAFSSLEDFIPIRLL